jgi:hypothetical protein
MDIDAAIRAKLSPVYTPPWAMRQYRDALAAALDLHQPTSNEAWAPGRSEVRDVCRECSPGEDDHYDQPWPCATVRAIAKALGIEVED